MLSLRQRLIQAVEMGDKETLSRLLTTFGLLVEMSYEYDNQAATRLLLSLEDTARDGLIGVSWKAPIPRAAEVEAALRNTA